MQAATLCAGSRGDGKPGPILVIYGSGDSYETAWTAGMPTCGVVDPSTNESYKTLFYSTKKGSMNAASGLAYFKAIAEMHPDISTAFGFRVMVICDGHGSHLTLEILTFCRAVGIDLVLRVPHTSQDTQNEDLELFGPLENRFVAAKGVRLAQVAAAKISHPNPNPNPNPNPLLTLTLTLLRWRQLRVAVGLSTSLTSLSCSSPPSTRPSRRSV